MVRLVSKCNVLRMTVLQDLVTVLDWRVITLRVGQFTQDKDRCLDQAPILIGDLPHETHFIARFDAFETTRLAFKELNKSD